MPRNPAPFDGDELRRLHGNHLTIAQIAALVGSSPKTVIGRLRKLRVAPRKRGRPPIRHLKVAGLATTEEIRGLAGWLRGAAGARSRVELAPSTAQSLAAFLEASVKEAA